MRMTSRSYFQIVELFTDACLNRSAGNGPLQGLVLTFCLAKDVSV